MHVMVNKKHENKNQEDLEITNEDTEITEPDLADVEAREVDIIKSLRDKLKVCDQEKREILEETQRVKADFLNARKRLRRGKTERQRASLLLVI
jgi:molecular chaperone GrpE (heat shock protein)